MTDQAERIEDPARHRARHAELRQALDELLGDFITHTGKLPSRSTILELLEWSSQQTREATPTPGVTQLQ